MKTLTKMFLLACWSLCFVTMSFATSTEQKLSGEAEMIGLQQAQQTEKETAEKDALYKEIERLILEKEQSKNNSTNAVDFDSEAYFAEKEALLKSKLESIVNLSDLKSFSSDESNVEKDAFYKEIERLILEKESSKNALTQEQEKINYYNSLKPGYDQGELGVDRNIQNVDFTVSGSRAQVELYFCTDSFANESSFNIFSADGTELYVGGYGAGWIGNSACESLLVDLADGDYSAVVYDSYGDGGLFLGVYNPGVSTYAEVTCTAVSDGGFGYVSGACGDATFTVGGAIPTCDDDTACNTGAEGDCTYAYLDLIVMVLA